MYLYEYRLYTFLYSVLHKNFRTIMYMLDCFLLSLLLSRSIKHFFSYWFIINNTVYKWYYLAIFHANIITTMIIINTAIYSDICDQLIIAATNVTSSLVFIVYTILYSVLLNWSRVIVNSFMCTIKLFYFNWCWSAISIIVLESINI